MKVMTMRGKELDMAALITKNAHVRAIGNANMNARGDVLDASGKVVKSRKQIMMEYHESPQAVKSVGLAALAGEMFASPAEAVANALAKNAMSPVPKAQPAPITPHVKKRKLIEDPDGDI
ncbi:unnamed protein product [Sphagnum tenellum]